MDAREVLYTTRAMRRLRPDPVPDDVVARIIDAGIRAPIPGGPPNRWRFVAVTDRGVMAALASVWQTARDALMRQRPNLYANEAQARSSGHLNEHFAAVPLLVLGYGAEGMDGIVGPALWQMCLAARAEGVGSTYTTLLARAEADVAGIVGVPADAGVHLVGALPMGYPQGRWGVAPRQPAHEVTYGDRWGTPPAWVAPPPPDPT